MDIKIINPCLREITRPNLLPNLLNIGLTGNIGSGKSTVAAAFKARRGAAVIDFDAIARRMTTAGGAAMFEIQSEFGGEMLLQDGSLNRSRMRDLIFKDTEAKLRLERITHRLISNEAIIEAGLVEASNASCIVYDIPLLVGNSKWLELLDCIVVVDCSPEEQVSRVLKRSPELPRETIENIINSQASRQQLIEIADVLIDNSRTETNHLPIYTQIDTLDGHVNYLTYIKLTQLENP